MSQQPSIWFPTVRAGTGTDIFTEMLVAQLKGRGFRAEITWLPLRAEYAPWSVAVPKAPLWANVVHVNTWLNPSFLPKRLPTVATIHHSIHHQDLRPYKGFARAAYHRWWIAPNERRVLSRANRIVAVSKFAAETARMTLLDLPIEVIYNGVDTARFRPGNRQRKLDRPFQLLYVGTWMARKGVDLFAPIMRELGSDFELRFTGCPAAIKNGIDVTSDMVDLGRLRTSDAVISAMQEADAFLFPSRSEGFGLVAAEAMSCGLPVIATRGSSLIEVVQDGETGILCPVDDVGAFVVAVRKLATDQALLQVMSSKARQTSVDRFSLDRMVEQYLEIYHGLLS